MNTTNITNNAPESLSTPVIAVMKAKADGKLFCRLDSHPGARFYPSRDCPKDLREGLVLVTNIIDKGEYGFVDALQTAYSVPDDEQIADYIRESRLHNAKVRFVHTRYGDLAQLRVKDDSGFRFINLCGEKDYARHCSEIDRFLRRDEMEIFRETTAAEIVAQQSYGMSIEEAKAAFAPVKFRFESGAMQKGTAYYGDDIDWAVDNGLVTQHVVSGITFFRVNDAVLSVYIGTGIVDHVASIVAPVNTEAQARFESMLKNRRMLVRNGVAVFHT